jgi:hypothetical protein
MKKRAALSVLKLYQMVKSEHDADLHPITDVGPAVDESVLLSFKAYLKTLGRGGFQSVDP